MPKNLVVLGGGESGVGAALLGQHLGYSVWVSDKGTIDQHFQKELNDCQIKWEQGTHSTTIILDANLVVKSPGIPPNIPILEQIREAGIELLSEIEFASQHTDADLIGITGTNGKTTTAMLTYHLLKSAGKSVGLAGNIGDSFAKAVISHSPDYWVLELSSFQLEDIVKFHPRYAVITNLSPDHLDRYDNSFDRYVDAKFTMFKNQTNEDFFIYDETDSELLSAIERHNPKAQRIPYSDKTIANKRFNKTDMITIDNPSLEGTHNAKNAMAAAAIAQLVNIRKQTIRESLRTFKGAPHRLEKVLSILKVDYINDSKATNVNATYYALDSITRPAIWIVGGVDKGNDYSMLMPLVREKVKAIICLGVDNEKIMDCFSPVVNLMVEANTMAEAVQASYDLAKQGDAVLLSPACASFDLFENYEDRGNQFKQLVRKL
ncbi:MAG: UDP-N-acetylmuramoyl-L-alanine--D-glutamate ligase [Flavobacteriaceae bacterium]|nr:UDP-N-acetylmuramoyl-L-alanine--D-glutamate ligase [Flavobacteriaceae bacterium]